MWIAIKVTPPTSNVSIKQCMMDKQTKMADTNKMSPRNGKNLNSCCGDAANFIRKKGLSVGVRPST